MFELLLAAAFFAEVIGTMAGFGSSTIFLPLALFFLDFKTALVLVAIFHIFGNLGRLTWFKHGLDKKLLKYFALPAVVLTATGALLVNYTPQATLKLVLGVFLLLYSLVSLYKPGLKFKATTQNAVIGGALSGFLAGLIGTGGALRGAFLTAFNLKKSRYIATSAAIALAVDFTRIPIYFSSGFLEDQPFYLIPSLFVVAIGGSFVGKQLIDQVPQKTFRKFVLAAIALVSLKFIYDGLVI